MKCFGVCFISLFSQSGARRTFVLSSEYNNYRSALYLLCLQRLVNLPMPNGLSFKHSSFRFENTEVYYITFTAARLSFRGTWQWNSGTSLSSSTCPADIVTYLEEIAFLQLAVPQWSRAIQPRFLLDMGLRRWTKAGKWTDLGSIFVCLFGYE